MPLIGNFDAGHSDGYAGQTQSRGYNEWEANLKIVAIITFVTTPPPVVRVIS